MNTLLIHDIKRPPRKQDENDYSENLKPHHRLAGFRLLKRGGKLVLLNAWGQVVEKFDTGALSPHPIWEAADRDVVYGCRYRG